MVSFCLKIETEIPIFVTQTHIDLQHVRGLVYVHVYFLSRDVGPINPTGGVFQPYSFCDFLI